MNKNQYLIKNIVYFGLGTIGTKLISFIMVPLYTGVLTTAEYGIIDLVMTVSLVICPILTMNIHESVLRFLLDANSDTRAIMSFSYLIIFFAGIVSLIAIPILGYIPELSEYKELTYFYILTTAILPIFTMYLRGNEYMKQFVAVNIISTFSTALLNIVFLLYFKWRIDGYLLALIFSNVIVIFISFISGHMLQNTFPFKRHKEMEKAMLKYSILLIPNSLLWWLISSSDRIMVNSFLGNAANGLYAVAYKIPSILNILSTIFLQAWQMLAIKDEKSNDKEEYANFILKSLIEIMFIGGAVMMLLIKPFMSIYVSEMYYSAWKCIPILVLAFIIQSISTFVATYYNVAKDSKGMLKSAVIGVIVNIPLNAMLIPWIGINGASIATCISYFVITIYRTAKIKEYIELKVFTKQFCIFLVEFLVLIGLVSFEKLFFVQVLLSLVIVYQARGVVVISLKRVKAYRNKKL